MWVVHKQGPLITKTTKTEILHKKLGTIATGYGGTRYSLGHTTKEPKKAEHNDNKGSSPNTRTSSRSSKVRDGDTTLYE